MKALQIHNNKLNIFLINTRKNNHNSRVHIITCTYYLNFLNKKISGEGTRFESSSLIPSSIFHLENPLEFYK